MTVSTLHYAQALGHEAADKRLDILKRIDAVGSISEAARGAGVSYKAAWQALDTLSNLAGEALVEKAVGGAGGGGARLTPAGHQLLEAAQLLNQARADVLATLGRREGSAPLAPGLAGLALKTSMRNHLPCLIRDIQTEGGAARVTLELANGATLTSRITIESVELLELAPGKAVLALCKATAVAVDAQRDRADGLNVDGLNVLTGEVTRLSSAADGGVGGGGEVSLRLMPGLQLVGFSRAGSGLQVGGLATATVEASAVVIAVTD